MKSKKIFIILMTLSILSFLGMLLVYPKLPDVMPTHFGFDGKADDYGPKSVLLILGLLPFAFGFLFWLLPRFDPRKESYAKHAKAYAVMCILTTVFIILCTWASVLAGLGYEMKIGTLIPVLAGVLFIILGNFMPQIRQNYFFGIKTPWALASENVWRKTHKQGGIIFCIMGIFMILVPFLPQEFQAGIMFLVILGGTTACYVYSYLIYRKCGKSGQ